MKKLISALLGATLFCAPAIAAEPATTAAPATQATVDIDPALWVVKDDDTTIYLFGTIHMLKPGLGWFDDGVKKAFDASDELVIEMIEPDPQTMMGVIQKLAMNPGAAPLSQQLGAQDRAAYTKALEALGIPYQAFEQARPWFAAMTLSALPIAKLGYDPANGPERILQDAAERAGKKIGQLETAEEQLGFFAKLTDAEQIDYLNVTVRMQDEIAPAIENLIALWSAADVEGVGNAMKEGMGNTPALDRVLLGERNTNWAGWIKTRLEQPGTVFLAVGAGHLAGEASVQTKLKALSIDTQRVPY